MLVLAVHGSVLLRLRQVAPAAGPAEPAAILMDLEPEASSPEPPPRAPAPIQPQPPEVTSFATELRPAESLPSGPAPPEPQQLDSPPQQLPDIAPPLSRAEVSLRKPPTPRRPAITRPAAKPAEASMPPESTATATPSAPPAPPSLSPPGQAVASWQSRLLAHLARFKRFPSEAQRRGEQGTVLMHVTMSSGGQVMSMTMTRGSGYADLDAEAQAWIGRAEPLPAFPPEITARQMELAIPLRFTLR
jgi:protein TonB